jgi:hypothetical protein
MATKKELRARALKAWRTRRKTPKAKGVPKEVLEIDEVLEIQNTLLKKRLKGKYSKKVRHLAALKAWKTRRENEIHRANAEVYEYYSPEDGPVLKSNAVLKLHEPKRKKSKKNRHLAAVKAWKTRKRNAEVEH